MHRYCVAEVTTPSAFTKLAMEGRSDREQLDWAATQGRVLVSFNTRHYAELADVFYREGKSHSGILVSPQIGFSDLLRLLLNVLTRAKPEHLKDTFQWLQGYR